MIYTKRAFTLMELIIVLGITALLLGFGGYSYSKAYRNNQIDRTESELRDMSNSFQAYILDYGRISISPDINYNNSVDKIIETLNNDYLNYSVELSKISDDKKSFELVTQKKTDAWNNPYKIYIYTDEGTGIDGLIIIASCGEDSSSNGTEYKNGNYGDDVLAIIEPN